MKLHQYRILQITNRLVSRHKIGTVCIRQNGAFVMKKNGKHHQTRTWSIQPGQKAALRSSMQIDLCLIVH